ncbi:MAG: anaerobic magnesium-protoporphyrin IX monomethyl ester cyclase [Myxococcota bacterium]|jgi:anaerobic magnesium-protoporphyrin IX monomethyl ester cyclase
MKALIVNPYTDTDRTAGRFDKFLEAMPPISIAYVAAALEQAGIDVACYDDFVMGGRLTDFEEAVRREKPDIIGFSNVTPTAPGVTRLSQFCRQKFPDIKLMQGGVHSTLFDRMLLEGGETDYVIHNEGEVTTVKLIECLASGGNIEDVDGISFLADGKYTRNKPRPMIEDLDTIPFPAWHLLPWQRYRLFNFARVADPATLVLGSRGCPYRCNFCSLTVMGHTRRKRSIGNLVDECEYMYDRYGMKQMAYVDPIFPISRKEAVAFRDEVVKRGLQKKQVWTTETRVDLMDRETVEAMWESGCKRVMFGFETGDQETLKAIRKDFELAQAYEAVRLCKQVGMQVIGFFIIGSPGETERSINMTIDFSCDLGIEFAKYTCFVPYPGTEIYNDFVKDGTIAKDCMHDFERYTSYPTEENPTIYTTEALSQRDLMRLQKKAFRKFYLRPKMIARHLFEIRALNANDMYNGLQLVFAPN